MKKSFRLLMFAFILFSCMAMAGVALGQGPPPPPGGQGGEGNQNPGGAPIGDGVSIMLFLGGGYGAWKLFKAARKKEEVYS